MDCINIQFKRVFNKRQNGKQAGIDIKESADLVELAVVAESAFQYGAEVFETHQQETTKAMTTDKATKNVPVSN